MGLTLETTTRNTACDAEVDLIDTGTSETEGYVTICTSGDAVLATLPLANPAFGNAAVGVATAASISSVTATGAGTAAKYKVYNRDDTLLWTGVVSASGGGGDMIISTTTIAVDDSVEITSWTHTVPAS